MTRALGARGHLGDAKVTSVQVEPVGQGAGILCQLARVTMDFDRPANGTPRTVIAKFPTTEPPTRQMVSLFRFYEREVRFYDEIAGQVPISVPVCYYSAFDQASGDFIVLLEDLGARRIGNQLEGCTLEDARLAVSELARLHAAWWNNPRLTELAWMPDADSATNMAGLALYPMAWGPFIERFGHKLPESMLRVGERLGNSFQAILSRFVAGPRTICHGDSRLDNFFFGTAGEPLLALLDWQIAIQSVGTYDIGYFTSQSLDPAMRRAHERDLLKLYHDRLREGGVTDYSFDQCLDDYRWTLLFCFAYPVMGGGMGDLGNERGYALASAMMERSAAAIMDWNAGELLDAI